MLLLRKEKQRFALLFAAAYLSCQTSHASSHLSPLCIPCSPVTFFNCCQPTRRWTKQPHPKARPDAVRSSPPLRTPAPPLWPHSAQFALGRVESSLELTWSVHEKDIKANLDNMHARYLHLADTHWAVRGAGAERGWRVKGKCCGCNSTPHGMRGTQETLLWLLLADTRTFPAPTDPYFSSSLLSLPLLIFPLNCSTAVSSCFHSSKQQQAKISVR